MTLVSLGSMHTLKPKLVVDAEDLEPYRFYWGGEALSAPLRRSLIF